MANNRRNDIKGIRSGMLTALRETDKKDGKRQWICSCECGAEIVVPQKEIAYQSKKSCGCQGFKRHGYSNTPEYRAWINMLSRCNNHNIKHTVYWWGRGIKVCKEWEDSFLVFLKDVGKRPSNKHSLDRINVDGDYEPNNVRWATSSQQGNNKTVNNRVTLNGKSFTVTEAARMLGIKENTLLYRLRRGWSEERALREP